MVPARLRGSPVAASQAARSPGPRFSRQRTQQRSTWCRARPEPNSSSVSDYEGTSSFVKGLVSGLTGLVNAVVPPAAQASEEPSGEPLDPDAVFRGVRSDFTDNCYLWTGEISAHIYDPNCVFTDPTLSFTGLSTFQRNLASLKPLLDRLLSSRSIDLRSCELLKGQSCVEARWRMTGRFRLPWRPLLDLTGCTRFTYDASRGGRVVRYDESWDIPASAALLQLTRPGPADP